MRFFGCAECYHSLFRDSDFDSLAFPACLANLLQRSRQGVAHVAEGLFAVVEHHDRPGRQVFGNVLQTGAGRETAVVVARNDSAGPETGLAQA